jgi:deazaflavin-dependent oxidoreductase (nitroreductase family)
MAELTAKPLSAGQVRFIKALLKPMTALNVWAYRMSGGKLMGTLKGAPVCLVTMVGRKSGVTRVIPLMFNTRGDDVILVASRAGTPTNPAWYYNLIAGPDVDIQVGKEKKRYQVRQADDAEKAELWPIVVGNYEDFALYQNRTERNIPVLVCSPVN